MAWEQHVRFLHTSHSEELVAQKGCWGYMGPTVGEQRAGRQSYHA